MKTYKVYDARNPRNWIAIRAKSSVQAIKKGYRWISKVPKEYLRAVRL